MAGTGDVLGGLWLSRGPLPTTHSGFIERFPPFLQVSDPAGPAEEGQGQFRAAGELEFPSPEEKGWLKGRVPGCPASQPQSPGTVQLCPTNPAGTWEQQFLPIRQAPVPGKVSAITGSTTCPSGIPQGTGPWSCPGAGPSPGAVRTLWGFPQQGGSKGGSRPWTSSPCPLLYPREHMDVEAMIKKKSEKFQFLIQEREEEY